MILTELSSVSSASLPIVELKQHLRLGTGFAEDGQQDVLLDAYLRAAMSAVEGRTGCVLLNKHFSWGLTAWRFADRQILPVRPVHIVSELKLVDPSGAETPVDAGRYRLVKDDQSPALVSTARALPSIPQNGSVEVLFEAGFGPDWQNIPDDLGRAVLLLAADFYENRTSQDATSLPAGVLALLERFRPVRLFGGV